MAKARISHKHRRSSIGMSMKLKKNAKVIEYSPTQELLDETFIAKAIWECLKNNDPEGVVEIIESALNRSSRQVHRRVLTFTRTMPLKGR